MTMRVLILKLVLKLLVWLRDTSVRNTKALSSSLGFEGVVRLLEQVEGNDAIALLRREGAVVEDGVRIYRGLTIHNAADGFSNLRIGAKCHIGRQVFLDLANPIHIGDRATISMRVTVLTHTNVGDSRCGLPSKSAGVQIGEDAYIGAGAMLLAGVNLGAGCIVASMAVVTMDVEPGITVAGVPARPLAGSAAGRSNIQQDKEGE